MKDLLEMLGVSRLACLCSTSPIFFPKQQESRKTLPHSAAPQSLLSPTHHPSAYLHPPPPFLLTLAKPLCMLIGGGLIQFAAVVDQWWITFPSFGHAPLAQGGGRTWRRKQQRSRAAAQRQTMWASVPPASPSLPILLQNNNNVFSDRPFLCHGWLRTVTLSVRNKGWHCFCLGRWRHNKGRECAFRGLIPIGAGKRWWNVFL